MTSPNNTPPSDHTSSSDENNSGMKQDTFPSGVEGWSWGAFLLSFIWGFGNNTPISVLSLVPYAGFGMNIYLGMKGRELAWKNKRWKSVEHFNRVQRLWSVCGVVLFVATIVALLTVFKHVKHSILSGSPLLS